MVSLYSNRPYVESSTAEEQPPTLGSNFGFKNDTYLSMHLDEKVDEMVLERGAGTISGEPATEGTSSLNPTSITSALAISKQPHDLATPAFTIPSNVSSKRNTAFHNLFPEVPANDYLIQEYGCTLQRECDIGGRLYLTENFICFHSNIYQWNRNFMIPFRDVTSLEKTMTTTPNAIRVYTRITSYTFTSLLLRDTAYDVMYNIWCLFYPGLESTSNEGAGSQDGSVIGLEHTHNDHFVQSAEVTSSGESASPARSTVQDPERGPSEESTAIANSLDKTLNNNRASLGLTENPINSVKEIESHTSDTSQYPSEASDTMSSYSPHFMASVVFECLTQHGCLDVTMLVNPLGFSSSAVAEGGYGDVWTGRFLNGAKIAIKVLRFTLSTGDVAKKELKRTAREIYNWSKLNHENVNKLIGVTMFRERLGMVSEWMEHGNLRQYLGRNGGVGRGELCVQIARGVAYLHSLNMVHGDLKAFNILVSSTGVIKITDFDYSIFPECSLVFSATTRVGGGTIRWMAPELVLEDNPPQRNLKTDIYALGMTFLETITNAEPYFECEREVQILRKLIRGEHPERSKEHFPGTESGNNWWKLFLRCWDFDPVSRPTSDEILESLLTLEKGDGNIS